MRAAGSIGLVTLVGCGGIIDGGDASFSNSDASDGANNDAPETCDAEPPMFPDKGCNSARDAICQQWAQSLAKFGASLCITPQGNYATCGGPDCNGNCCAGGPVCGTDQVCASVIANGPHQCVKACAGF